MSEPQQNSRNIQVSEAEETDFKQLFFKYVAFWPWFLGAIIIAMTLGYLYARYTPPVYNSTAKIKIIDDSKEMDVPLDAASLLTGNKINMDNEIQVLKSYRILEQVVKELHLDVSYVYEGQIMDVKIWNPDFKVIKNDSLSEGGSYTLTLKQGAFKVTDLDSEKQYTLTVANAFTNPELPFYIAVDKNKTLEDGTYQVSLLTLKKATINLMQNLQVSPASKESEILSLGIKGQSAQMSEAILNTVIRKFNEDGILDRQLVSKRTMDFIDERFDLLAVELDSIEDRKEEYKQETGQSFIEADSEYIITKKAEIEDQRLNLEQQKQLTQMLQEALEANKDFTLLPANIGIENQAINTLVLEYNTTVLALEKTAISAGENNVEKQSLQMQLLSFKENILRSIAIYQEQLGQSLQDIEQVQRNNAGAFGAIPNKEKITRAINRQQTLKENLYLMLLQKREEAAIKYAVTSPSIKVVDYALTDLYPVAPKKKMIFLVAIFIGTLIPFGIITLLFQLDNKIHGKVDLEKQVPNVPVLAELPFVEGQEILNAGENRSTIAEAFRILSTNVEYLLPEAKPGKGRVVFVTSTRKGEGKTFVALNLSLALASLDKKVLLVGSDLRNPQLHRYFNQDKNFSKGLSGYLFDKNMAFEECLEEGFTEFPTHKICFSGIIPPNAPQLLASQRYADFLEEAREHFDYVIVDTAPTILVTDTLMISKYADETVFVTRADYTEKEILNFAKELFEDKKLNNMAFVVNAVGKSSKKYGYGYKYGYSYGYGYNYGYGYGYGSDEEETPKKKGLFGKKKK